MRAETAITIEGKKLALSNLDKVLYPSVGFTKAQVIDYSGQMQRSLRQNKVID